MTYNFNYVKEHKKRLFSLKKFLLASVRHFIKTGEGIDYYGYAVDPRLGVTGRLLRHSVLGSRNLANLSLLKKQSDRIRLLPPSLSPR